MTTQSYDTSGAGPAGPENSRAALEAQRQAFNAGDAAGFASFYAEDALVIDPQYPEPLRGRQAIQQDAEVILRAFSNYEFSIRTTLVDDRIIAAEASFEGMNDGPLSLPSGEVPATGRRLKFDLAFFSRLDESGKIVEERRYYDVADQLTQLGLA